VDEEVLRAVVRGDEAEALFTVEPFHSSLCHLLTSLISNADVPNTSSADLG
jgi:hypothetical protein